MDKKKHDLEIERIRAEISHRMEQTLLASKQAELTDKHLKWYEIVLIATGAAGLVSIGVAVARLTM